MLLKNKNILVNNWGGGHFCKGSIAGYELSYIIVQIVGDV